MKWTIGLTFETWTPVDWVIEALHVLELKSVHHWASFKAIQKYCFLPRRVAMLLVDGQDLLNRSAPGCLGIFYPRQDYPDCNLRFRYQIKPWGQQLYTGDADSSAGRDVAQCMEQAGAAESVQWQALGKGRGQEGSFVVYQMPQVGQPFPSLTPQEQRIGSGMLFKSLERNNTHQKSLWRIITEKNLMYSRAEKSHMWNGNKLKMDRIGACCASEFKKKIKKCLKISFLPTWCEYFVILV